MDKYCERCYARDAKPCMECSTCNPGHHNFRSAPASPPTHADRIRSMSDEDMAERNVIMVRSSSPNKLGYELVYRCSDKYETDDYDWALKHELDWLRQPAEEVIPNDTD